MGKEGPSAWQSDCHEQPIRYETIQHLASCRDFRARGLVVRGAMEDRGNTPERQRAVLLEQREDSVVPARFSIKHWPTFREKFDGGNVRR